MSSLIKYRTMRRFVTVQLSSRIAQACFFSLFPIFLINKGLSILDLSIFGAIFSGGIVLFEIPTGIIADRIRKDVCIKLAHFLSAIAYILIYINQSFYMIIIAYIIMALSAAFLSGVAESWLFDGLEQEGFSQDFGEITSKILIVDSLGGTIGLVIGGAIAIIKIEYSFLAGLILVLATVLLSLFLINNNQTKNIEKNEADETIIHYLKGSLNVITAPFLVVSVTMAFVAFAIASPLNTLWQLHFKNVGVNNEFILSNIYVIRTILIIVGGAIAGKITKYFTNDKLRCFRLMIICSSIALFISAVTNVAIISLIFWSIISITNTIARTFWASQLLYTIDKNRRSTLLSINSLIFSSASILGNLSMGAVAQKTSIEFSWIICSFFLVLAIIFSFFASQLCKLKI